MTRPFLSVEECVEPKVPGAADPAPIPPLLSPAPQQQPMMFTRAKFSRFEVLPPVLCTRRIYVQVGFLLLIGLIILLVRMMAAMRGSFVHFHLESDTDGELVILPKDFAAEHGAACLDGSPPAYYYRESFVPAVRFWIVHLQSGGWCTTAADCLLRSTTPLGSSLKADISMPMEGFMSSDCATNKHFCMWHMVDILYCDGGSFLGNRSDPLTMNSKELHMKGAKVFDAVIEYLTTHTLFKDAEQIIIAGSSAGSIGALVHADRLRERLSSQVKTVHVLVDGGLFVDVPDVHSNHAMASMLKDTFHLHHIHKSASMKQCMQEAKAETDRWRCFLPEVFHRYVFTPIFFFNSLYDTWFRRNALDIHCPLHVCSDIGVATVNSTRGRLLEEGAEILRSKKNGVFLTPCPMHTVLMKKKFFSVTARGRTAQQALGQWINHQGDSRNLSEPLVISDALKSCPDH